jgi:cell division protein FtsB
MSTVTVKCECGRDVLIYPPMINADLVLFIDDQAQKIKQLDTRVVELRGTISELEHQLAIREHLLGSTLFSVNALQQRIAQLEAEYEPLRGETADAGQNAI